MSRLRGIRERCAGERGQVIPLVAVMLVVLIGFAALAVDVGNAYLHKRRLQAAVDLSLISAAQKLPDTAAAGADAKYYIDTNWAKRDSSSVNTTVTTSCQVAGCPQTDKITVDAKADVPTFLAKVLGVDKITVHARGSACGPCDTTVNKFDVMVVVDRSYSMCLDSNGANNGCADLANAVAGVKSLLGFFSPTTDRVGLTLLSSGDDHIPNSFHTGGPAPRCDGANINDLAAGKGTFYNTLGDFMDGTGSNHDTWVVAPLANDFKNPDGSLNNSSGLVSTLNCVQSKLWTPIAPAIKEATDALINTGRPDAKKFLVFLGDGGANVQPMQRDANGNVVKVNGVQQFSWYTPTAGNNLRPCHDAVGQAARAKANNITVYTIGYDLNATTANTCYIDNVPSGGVVESGIDARSAMQQMATDNAHFFEKATPGEVYSIFNAIGRLITSGGVRLVD